jgi:hypothetical protein
MMRWLATATPPPMQHMKLVGPSYAVQSCSMFAHTLPQEELRICGELHRPLDTGMRLETTKHWMLKKGLTLRMLLA